MLATIHPRVWLRPFLANVYSAKIQAQVGSGFVVVVFFRSRKKTPAFSLQSSSFSWVSNKTEETEQSWDRAGQYSLQIISQ